MVLIQSAFGSEITGFVSIFFVAADYTGMEDNLGNLQSTMNF